MKRILYTLACLMLGISAWADNVAKIGDTEYATLAEAVAAATDGQTVTLIDDVSLTAVCNIGDKDHVHERSLTIDFAGHSISSSAATNGQKILNIYDDVTLTGDGNIQFGGSGMSAYAVGAYGNVVIDGVNVTDIKNNAGYILKANANATLTLKSGTITSDKPRSVVYVAKDGDFVMDGGKLVSNYNTANSSAACVHVVAGGTATINAGELEGAMLALYVDGEANITGGKLTSQHIVWVNKGTANISGGEFYANPEAVYLYTTTAKANISGGEFWATGSEKRFLLNIYDSVRDGASFSVTGGTFHEFNPWNNTAEGAGTCFVPDGYEFEDNGDGSFTIKEKDYVAQIGETKYESLAEAIAEAQNGETVTLLADITDNIIIPAGKNITLDLNEKTLNGKRTANTPTIKNLGTLTVKNGNVRRTGEGSESWYVIENEGTITMDEGLNVDGSASSSLIRNNAATAQMTFNAGTYTQTGAFIVVKNDLGNVVINGGTFSTASDKNVLNNWDQMTINGGTFTGNIFNGAYDTDNNKLTINDGTFNASQIRTYLGNGKTTCPIEIKGGKFTNAQMKYVGTGNKESDTDVQVAVSGGTFANPVPEQYCANGYIPTADGEGHYGVKEGQFVAQIGDVKYETIADAISAAENGTETTVTLITDVIENITIPAGKNITLDLNGKTLNGKQVASSPTIKNLGTLTVKNGNVRRTGEGTASYYVIENMGTITLDEDLDVAGSANASLIRNNAATAQMTFNAGTYTQTGAFIVVKNDLGTVEINGGTFSTASDKNVLNNWDQMTINGGTFTGNIFNGAYDTDNNKLTINDGTFNANQIRTYLGNGKTTCPIEIKGGKFTNAQMKYVGTGNKESDTDVQVAVSGGTFANPVPEKYCATGFIPKDNGNGTYGVKEGAYVARIGEQGYETLDEAIETAEQAETATTITLLTDAETEKETLPANVTIDANDNVLTMPSFVVLDGEAFTLPKITGAETYKVKTATYIRTNISATEWGTVCLPFSLTSGNGADYYTYNNISGSTLTVDETTTVAPNIPVVFNKGTGDLEINQTDATVSLKASEASLVNGALVGAYEMTNIPADGSIYFINGDQFHKAQVSVKVPMYRAYIKNTEAGAKPAVLNIVVGGDDDATAIGTLTTGDVDVEAIYDAAGRKLQAPQKGMNIMKLANGKTVKLLIK